MDRPDSFANLQPGSITGIVKGFWQLQGDSCISLQGLTVMDRGLTGTRWHEGLAGSD